MVVLLQLVFFPGLLFVLAYGFALDCFYDWLRVRHADRKHHSLFVTKTNWAYLWEKLSGATVYWGDIVLVVASVALATLVMLDLPLLLSAGAVTDEAALPLVVTWIVVARFCWYLVAWRQAHRLNSPQVLRAWLRFCLESCALYVVCFAPALLAQSIRLAEIVSFYAEQPLFILCNLPALFLMILLLTSQYQDLVSDNQVALFSLAQGIFDGMDPASIFMLRIANFCQRIALISLAAVLYLPFYTGSFMMNLLLYFAKTVILFFAMQLLLPCVEYRNTSQVLQHFKRLFLPLMMGQIVLNLVVSEVIL